MSMEQMRALLRTFTPGRRARFNQESEAVRDKVPQGIVGGVIIQILPLIIPQRTPSHSADPDGEPPMTVFGLEIEFDSPAGLDAIVLGTDDVILDPLDLAQLRGELMYRTVRFARSSGIGIDFPEGAEDDGLIEDVRFRREEDGSLTDLVVDLRIAVNPLENPQGLDVFRTEADFTQCQLLRRRTPPAKK